MRKNIKRSSAAGPDGVDKVFLVKWDPTRARLAGMYNGFLVRASIPACLKLNRTTLLPKSHDPTARKSIANWRPMLFLSILHKRLASACSTSVRQKGFTNAPGCSENRRSRLERSPLAMVFIDLAKAFDSVSHDHIRAVLEDRGVDQTIVNLVADCYNGCSRRVEATRPGST